MNKQLTLVNAVAPTFAVPARFDLQSTGLSDAQLKTIAGARPCQKTCDLTSGITRGCCWGG